MNGLEVVVTASAGLNVFILGALILNSYRIGKIEGIMKNGNFHHCPFYRSHVNKEVRAGQQNGKNTKC